jgi:hypothetical protein
MYDLRTSCALEEAFDAGDMELTRRLEDLRQEPPAALLARVRAVPDATPRQKGTTLRLGWSLVAVAVLAIVLVSTSAPLRAAMDQLQMTIGRIYLSIADSLPDISHTTIIEPELMTLKEARAAVPFEFDIPAQIPLGWQMAEPVRLNDLGNGPYIHIDWACPGRGNIVLSIRAADPDDGTPGGWLVAPESSEEIQINGEPAVLIRGGWDADTHQWAWPEVTTIGWTRDGVEYRLEAGADVSTVDLIGMAESVP